MVITAGSVLSWAGFEQQCGDRGLCASLPNPLSLGLGRVGSREGGRVRLACSVGRGRLDLGEGSSKLLAWGAGAAGSSWGVDGK